MTPQAYPRRKDEGVTPLIEGSEAYPAFERLALSATGEILFGIRIFDPETRTRSDEAKHLNLSRWDDLIAHATKSGVDVRIHLTDFEPIVANDMHQTTWRAVEGFREAVEAKGDPKRFQIIAALHEGEFGIIMRHLMWPFLRVKVGRIAREDERVVGASPGLWKLIRPSGRGIEAGLTDPPRMWPATHHQKLMVVDGETAIIGGLDIDERRHDDPDHMRPGQETWHDVSLEVEGAVARDARNHLVSCWNRDVPRFNARLAKMGAPHGSLPGFVTPLEPSVVSATGGNKQTVQLLRTRSRRSRSKLAVGPRPVLNELEAAHIDQIHMAEDLIYLETQFLRSPMIADALAEAGCHKPSLRLIVVLPAAPDDVAFDGHTGPDARHGEWLQVRAVDKVMSAFGSRCGFFSLAKAEHADETEDRETAEGREMIYVHAKVAIVDGRDAIVSSANLNGRSLKWDTEAGVRWVNARDVRAFQQRLWSDHLRNGFDALAVTGARALAMWTEAAESAALGRGAPQVVRYPLEGARAFAQRMPFVPTNMI